MSREIGGLLKTSFRKSHSIAKKKACSLFTPMSVAHVDDNEAELGNIQNVDKLLSTGDFYTGQWADGCPHGNGKYLWTDGCMYVGEWYKGKTNGKGKFSWPSGATYEGDFKSGFMDGIGTYTNSFGDTYRGAWVMNLKHGQGTKRYANGDYYDGEWRKGYQDGQGKYQWKKANQYIGQWRNGIMNGNGTMILNNGNRYDGFWEGGLPRGNGTFRWADGSFYVGFWSKDPKELSGTYYPSGSQNGNLECYPKEVLSKEFTDCKICQDETLSIYPSEKTVGVEQKKGNDASVKSRRMSVDGRVSNYSAESDGIDRRSREGFEGLGMARSPDLRIKPPKKQGATISKGHKNYELMLNLQLGIRHSVGRPAPSASLDLKPSAFDPKEKMWTKFPPEGSKHTPPHPSCDFRWKDYCPVVFRSLRKLFKVDPADYMISLCGNDALRELSSPGKSGSFFYLTNDDRYMIKTMRKAEVKVLLRMLPAYYKHVRSFENTLVTKFYGLHCVKLTGSNQKKVRFVIMGNLFCSDYSIHRRFDLKGSSHGRTTDKPESEVEPTTTLKDLDLNYLFRLQKAWFQDFCKQVDKDCEFLEQERIMDYSMLVGLHFRDVSNGDPLAPMCLTPGASTPTGNGNTDIDARPCLSRVDMDQLLLDPSRLASVRLGISMPARVERTVRKSNDELVGEPTGQTYDVIMFFNIIDILQDYDISKKLEHAYKSFQYDPTSISAVDPKQYSRRFRDFIFRVFIEDI